MKPGNILDNSRQMSLGNAKQKHEHLANNRQTLSNNKQN